METRSYHRWKTSSGVKNYLNLKYIDFETNYPVINCNNLDFENIVTCNNYKKINKKSLVSMFVDDYILERFWRNPENYISRYKAASLVMSPDFSILVGMPTPLIYWQVYRSRLIGYIWQKKGINVIPCISWSDYKSFDIVFSGIKKGSMVAVSNIGCRNDTHFNFFQQGYKHMLKTIKPKKVLFMCNKKYKSHFKQKNVVFINSFWDNKRNINYGR